MPEFIGDDIADYPLPAFFFKVEIGQEAISFQEVSGISSEIEFEQVKEGGENGFVHQLPTRVKHGNLELKRGIAPKTSSLYQWCSAALGGMFGTATQPKTVIISLLGKDKTPLLVWTLGGVYPMKWDVDPFNSTKNEVAIEKIVLRYNTLSRESE